MKNVSKAFEYLRLRFVAVLCCIKESGPDLVNPSTLLSPSWKIKINEIMILFSRSNVFLEYKIRLKHGVESLNNCR